MSQNPTRREITTQALLAALGLAVAGSALAADPPEQDKKVAVPALMLKASLFYASDDAEPSCLTGLAEGAPRLQLKLEVENLGDVPVEVIVNDRRVQCDVRIEALVPGQEEPWMLDKAATGCGRPVSRAIRREQLPLLPKDTLVMGTWDVRWPGGLEMAGAKVKLTSSLGLASGTVPLPEQTVDVPVTTAA